MVHYRVDIQDDVDNGYGFYCNLEPQDNVRAQPLHQKLKNIPPELYPAEYYFEDDYHIVPGCPQQCNDAYKQISNKFKSRAYAIFSELSFACLCIATTFCIMKYYK